LREEGMEAVPKFARRAKKLGGCPEPLEFWKFRPGWQREVALLFGTGEFFLTRKKP